MSLWSLLSNTIEGTVQTTLGATKAVVGIVTAPLDEGRTLESGLENMSDGVEKIGKGETHD